MAYLTDIAVNLMGQAFDNDRKAVLEAARAAGVNRVIITGCDIETSVSAYEFVNGKADGFAASLAGNCYSTAGIHPHNAKNWNEEAKAGLKELLLRGCKSVIAAVGECGLDYNRNFSPQDIQRKCFEDQLAIAAELGKPVFLHERDAFEDFYSILKQYRPGLPGAVVHCFTGTEAELEAYISLDCHIGITGWVCDERRGGHLIPLVKNIPQDKLLLETDSPYLLPRNLPRSVKGKSGRNEPRFLPYIAAFTAEILGVPFDRLAEQTSANASALFDI